MPCEAAIVVVEDDESMRSALVRMLRAAGYATTAFSSAEDCLAAPPGCVAACLVLDINLPGLSGLELHARLAAVGRAAPVVFITAHGSDASREAAARAGALAYLLKPFAGRDLLSAIARTTDPHGVGADRALHRRRG